MSILIKGMEMPTSCYKCPFLDYEEGFCFASGVKGKSGGYEFFKLWPGGIKGGRHDDCPLVAVPQHGRLIDADALVISTAVPLDGKPYQYVHIDNIKAAPTIIPAEEGE